MNKVVGDGTPRVVESAAAAAGRQRIKGLLPAEFNVQEQAGEITRGVNPRVKLVNLVGRIAGTDPAAGVLAVVAHTDSAPTSPGASDDGVGVVAAVQVARDLVAHPPRHDVVLLLTDGEEAGLLGAQLFMGSHPWAPEVKGVLNLDARGASGPAFVFEFGPNTQELVALMKRHVRAPRSTSLAEWIYRQMPNATDFLVFRRAGATGFNLAFIGDHPAYHTPLDTVERQNPSTRLHFVQTARELMRALDQVGPWQNTLQLKGIGGASTRDERMGAVREAAAVPAQSTWEQCAWTDVLGLWILEWPSQWSAGLAIALSGLVLAPAIGQALVRAGSSRRRQRHAGAVAITVGGTMVAAIVAGGLGMLAALGARSAGVDTRSAPVRALLLHALIWAAAALLVVGLGALVARKARRDGECESASLCSYAGVWIVWCVLACTAGFLLPAATPFLVVPVAAAAIGGAAGAVGGSRRMVIGGSLGGAAGAALIWMPYEPAFHDALGLHAGPVTGVRALLVLLPLVPLVACAAKRDWLGSNQQPSVS